VRPACRENEHPAGAGCIFPMDGAVEQSNFNDYNVMRMSDMPEELNIAFLDSDAPPTGLGEVGAPFVMPAVPNAFYRLSGNRLHHMPFTAERVRGVLKA
jgi:isoquinoline 1-oxidoreductase beta subunit